MRFICNNTCQVGIATADRYSGINYFNNNCKPKAFWQFTGSNDIIGEVLANADEDIYERLNMLMQRICIQIVDMTGITIKCKSVKRK